MDQILLKNRGPKSLKIDKNWPPKTEIYDEFIPKPIKSTFRGGFAGKGTFGDGFSGSIEGPKIDKNHKNR
jgi:hypothetical protein